MLVNHKFQFFWIFLEVYFYRTISFLLSFIYYAIIFLFIILYVLFFNKTLRCMALRRSHFQCGNMQGEGHLRVP